MPARREVPARGTRGAVARDALRGRTARIVVPPAEMRRADRGARIRLERAQAGRFVARLPPVPRAETKAAAELIRPVATRAELVKWERAYPHDGSDDERRRALDEFVVDLVHATDQANRRNVGTFIITRALVDEELRRLNYRQSAIDDYRVALAERNGRNRVRSIMQRARRYAAWTRALQRALEIVFSRRDPFEGDR